MVWLFEKPLFIVAMGLLTAVILGGLWMQTGRKSALGALLLSIGLTVGLLLVERLILTDHEQIEAVLHRVAGYVERNDIEAALRYTHSSADWIRRVAMDELPRYDFRDVDIKSNLSIEIQPNQDPPKAVARFNVVVVLSERDGLFHESRIPRFVTVLFQKEGDDWRVIDYHHRGPYEGYRRRR